MEAIRRIMTVRNNELKVALPAEYNDRQVELIILPMKEEAAFQVNEEKADYFTRFYGTMKSNLSDEELDQKLKALRDEWKRDTY